MTSFASSFWVGGDYGLGLDIMYDKLQQGLQETEQILTIARLRADAEDAYGQKLGDISDAVDRIDEGFDRDEGASLKRAYEGVLGEMVEGAKSHQKIATNIRELVITPFSRWADEHSLRINRSEEELQARLKNHDKQADYVRTCRSQYFNKCRRVEDLDEEEKLGFQDPLGDIKSPKAMTPMLKSPEMASPYDEDAIRLGDDSYGPERLKQTLAHMLQNIKLGDTKVPILGTYHNVSTGSDIVDYIQKNMGGNSTAYAEKVGQDILNNGFLRLVGTVGSTFTNSSRMNYQWRPKAFKVSEVIDRRESIGRSGVSAAVDALAENPGVAAAKELVQGWNPLNNTHQNESPAERLRKEAKESDEKYRNAVKRLDGLRCELEEAMFDHMKFMERCELDRLNAIKSVILDFCGAIGNVIPALQSMIDRMMLFQETIQPNADLRYILENYRTGSFSPRVQIYENYYNQVGDQIFGVDIEARARADQKRLPLIVTNILTYLDDRYPELEGDENRRAIWLVEVPLSATHHLRSAIDSSKGADDSVLAKYDVPIVASVLKLYLLELPDSLVSSSVYEIIKTIYTTTAHTTDDATRVSVLQSTLGQLRLTNIAALDAITAHFTRMLELTGADEAYTSSLATSIASCILRPKQETSMTITEKFNVRLVRDLFAHRDVIFGELKRNSTLSQASNSSKAGSRDRAESRPEQNRKEAMEERQRAIQANHDKRAPSPGRANIAASGTMGHRRDRSTNNAETRFSGLSMASGSSSRRADSLEVPMSPDLFGFQSFDGMNNGPSIPPKDERPISPPGNGASNQDLSLLTSSFNGNRDRYAKDISSATSPLTQHLGSEFLNLNAGPYQSPSMPSLLTTERTTFPDAKLKRNSLINIGYKEGQSTPVPAPSPYSRQTSTNALSGSRRPTTAGGSSNADPPEKRNSLSRSGASRSSSNANATTSSSNTTEPRLTYAQRRALSNVNDDRPSSSSSEIKDEGTNDGGVVDEDAERRKRRERRRGEVYGSVSDQAPPSPSLNDRESDRSHRHGHKERSNTTPGSTSHTKERSHHSSSRRHMTQDELTFDPSKQRDRTKSDASSSMSLKSPTIPQPPLSPSSKYRATNPTNTSNLPTPLSAGEFGPDASLLGSDIAREERREKRRHGQQSESSRSASRSDDESAKSPRKPSSSKRSERTKDRDDDNGKDKRMSNASFEYSRSRSQSRTRTPVITTDGAGFDGVDLKDGGNEMDHEEAERMVLDKAMKMRNVSISNNTVTSSGRSKGVELVDRPMDD